MFADLGVVFTRSISITRPVSIMSLRPATKWGDDNGQP